MIWKLNTISRHILCAVKLIWTLRCTCKQQFDHVLYSCSKLDDPNVFVTVVQNVIDIIATGEVLPHLEYFYLYVYQRKRKKKERKKEKKERKKRNKIKTAFNICSNAIKGPYAKPTKHTQCSTPILLLLKHQLCIISKKVSFHAVFQLFKSTLFFEVFTACLRLPSWIFALRTLRVLLSLLYIGCLNVLVHRQFPFCPAHSVASLRFDPSHATATGKD